MKLKMIAAIGKNNELGKNNDLIWKLKEDLLFFKEKTINKTVVMGDNTFFSLPKMLPNRKHIVLSIDKTNFPEEVEVFNNIEDFYKKYNKTNEDIYIIGGGTIYKLFINEVEEIYLTEINAIDDMATVYFPKFNKENFIKEELCSHIEDEIEYKHVLYRRK